MGRGIGSWVRIFEVIGLPGLSSKLLELLIHADYVRRSSAVFGIVALAATLVAVALKIAGLLGPRFELRGFGSRRVSSG